MVCALREVPVAGGEVGLASSSLPTITASFEEKEEKPTMSAQETAAMSTKESNTPSLPQLSSTEPPETLGGFDGHAVLAEMEKRVQEK